MPCPTCTQTQNTCTCTQTTTCVAPDCSCPVNIGTDCWTYTGDDLECSGIKKDTIGTELIQQLDAFICSKFDEVGNYLVLRNVGVGAEVYKGLNLLGEKELRSIIKTGDLVTVTENANDIEISIDEEALDTFIEANQLTYSVDNVGTGAEIYKDSTVVGDNTQLNLRSIETTGDLITVTQNADDVAISIDEAELTTFIENAQIQVDVLEANNTAPSYINNKNPEKTVPLGVDGNYNVVDADNNYVIEIDNGENNVTITVSTITETSNFFTGFIQKGTGTVTFVGYDEVPATLDGILYGKGHVASVSVIAGTKYINGNLKIA